MISVTAATGTIGVTLVVTMTAPAKLTITLVVTLTVAVMMKKTITEK